jgi:YVTN family beta-propeller protein
LSNTPAAPNPYLTGFRRHSAARGTAQICESPTSPSPAAQTIPNTGQLITPAAPPGAQFLALIPGLADIPSWRAGQAVTSISSPDHKTLLVLTSGYNRVNYMIGPNAGSRNAADSNEYVFVYDISHTAPVQKQVIQVPNTYNGIVFDPSGTAFYVSGGVNDNVHIFGLKAGAWVEQAGSPVVLGHGGQGVGAGVAPAAAGIAITNDGTKLVVTDYYNDSISILTSSKGVWTKTAELDLRPGKINPQHSGVPGGEFPFWVTIKGNSTAYVSSIRDREIVVVDIAGAPSVTTRIKLKGQPLKSTLNAAGTTLYVAEDQADSVAVINTVANKLVTEASAIAPAEVLEDSNQSLRGANTNSVTLSPEGTRLYVTNGNHNDVAVLNVVALGAGNAVLGPIPTEWYPSSVTLSGDGKQMYVVNFKTPRGPNPTWCYGNVVPGITSQGCNAGNQYDLQLIKAGLQSFPTPDIQVLAQLTQRVSANNHFEGEDDSPASDTMQFLHQKIQHIIKENKTFDQILGDSGIGAGDPALTEFGAWVTPNEHALARNFVTLDHFYDSSEVSYDEWAWSTSAKVTDIVARQTPVNYAGRGLSYESEGYNRNINVSYAALADRIKSNPSTPNDPDVLPGTTDEAAPDGPGNQINTGYLWNQALRAGLTVRDYGFFFQNVGPSVLSYFSAGVAAGYSTAQALHPLTDQFFRGFDMNVPDYYQVKEWEREFDANYAKGGMPNLTLLRLPHDHTGNFGTALAGLNTPSLQVADNDYAVGLVAQKIANSIYAGNTLIFVIEDDAQNGGDHLDAHRSIAFIVGPYVKQNALVSTPYNTVNFVRTMEEILGLGPLNLNDSVAKPMADVFDTHQAKWTYTATPSALLCSTQLPLNCKSAGLRVPKEKHNAAYWARVSKGLDFSKEDLVDPETYNRILWKGIMGNKPYPGDRNGFKASKRADRDSDD